MVHDHRREPASAPERSNVPFTRVLRLTPVGGIRDKDLGLWPGARRVARVGNVPRDEPGATASAPAVGTASAPIAVRAALFDLDGVVTDTATLHAQAWKEIFDESLPSLTHGSVRPFDASEEYRRLVYGRSRQDGVRAVLAARRLSVPEGTPEDGPEQLTLYGLAARKQDRFVRLLTRGGVQAYPSTVALLRRLRHAGLPTAVVTASRNSELVLQAAGVRELFDAVVDGNDVERLGLPGKPDPALYLEAAHRLGVPPVECFVAEDAVAGVQAARRGGFGLVLGVDRTGNRSRLAAAGAHDVVADLAGVDPSALVGRLDGPLSEEPWRGGASAEGAPWVLTYHGFDPAQEGTREALCTLANGYLGTRGAASECGATGVHYPGTYLAGVYNRLETTLHGQTRTDEHMINAPNWLPLWFALPTGRWLSADSPELDDYRQDLDLRRGVLSRRMRFQDSAGRTLTVSSERLVSQHACHLAAIRTTFEAENWSGRLRVRSALDAGVVNANVPALAQLADRHLRTVRTDVVDPETVRLEVITTQSAITVAMAARTRFSIDGAAITPATTEFHLPDQIGQEVELSLDPGLPVTVEKIVAVATSRDRAISTPALAVAALAARAADFPDLLADHERAWADIWRRFGVTVEAGERARTALNLHTFHVLQTAASSTDVDAGLPARGLSGEGYGGHVFWDEVLVHPLLTLRQPELTRISLQYRYRRLGEAQATARAAGLAGALFPWQSGSDGRDETPIQLFNPLSGTWMPDNSRRQRHVGLAIAYSVIQYVEASDDWNYLAEIGMGLIVEVVRCFASMATYDPRADRYDIDGVMGPDEFHDGYPGRPGSGLRNNAYTNILLAWIAGRAAALLSELDRRDDGRTRRRLGLSGEELERWDRLTRRLRVPFHADGVISQFEGYADLAELDWSAYRARYDDIGRLDLILAAEGDTPNRYRASKQPDVLMLLYLLSAEDLRATLERLDYQLDGPAVRRTVAFYLSRTSHGSTLSRPVCSWLLARADRAQSWSLFNEALDSDLADIQGGTTREGIHLGAMAGTVDLLLRCYPGLETRDGALWLHPALPLELGRVRFEVGYRGHGISVDLTPSRLTLHLQPRAAAPIQVHVEDEEVTLHAGHSYTFDLPMPARVGRLPDMSR